MTNKTNIDKFKLKFIKKEKTFYINKFKKLAVANFTQKQWPIPQAKTSKLKSRKKVSNTMAHTFLKLLDINGEILKDNHAYT